MITLVGHGYVGNAIAVELRRQRLPFYWRSHLDFFPGGTAIINAAGFTGAPNVDACETDQRNCIKGNVLWPVELERRAAGLAVVHISSGCIYDGYKPSGWAETDPPNFGFGVGSFYSGCKALAEEVLAQYLGRSYVLRIRIPFGLEDHPKNYLSKLRAYEKLIDVRNSLSCVEDVARVAIHFATKLPPPGIYNVCNPGSVTTREVADMLGLSKQWFTSKEFAAAVKAPRSNCVLNVEKLQAVFPIEPIAVAMANAVKAAL